MKLKSHIIFSLFFIFSLYYSYGSSVFKNITTDNGLSSNTVNCIYKDSNKLVWLGLPNGLNRFNGNDILPIKSFENHFIVSIAAFDSFNLMVSTDREIYNYNYKRNNKTKIEIPLGSDVRIRKTLIDEGKLLLITDKGLYIFEDGKLERVGKIKNEVTDIAIDSVRNTYWITSTNGFFAYNRKTKELTNYKIRDKTDVSDYFSALTIDGNLIYLAKQNSIYSFDIVAKKEYKITNIDNNLVLNINCADGKLYVGTNGGGLKIISTADYKLITLLRNKTDSDKSISSNAIYSLLIDGPRLWIGTFVGGLNYTPTIASTFKIYNKEGVFDSQDTNIRSMSISGEESILGTRDGFIYIKNNKKYIFNSNNTPSFTANIVLTIYKLEDKYLIGTYGGGLYEFHTKTLIVKKVSIDHILDKNSFYSITKDSENNIWFGTLNGLVKYNRGNNKYEIYTTENSKLIDKNIFCIASDSQDRIWIGTNEGICYYENGSIRTTQNINLSFVKTVRCLHIDSKENIWIGSEREALIKVNRDITSFEQITKKDFLPDDYILNIIEDKNNQLWISTPKGMVRYNPDSGAYRLFSLRDGIPWSMFNTAAQLTDDGVVWWGNEKGLVYLNPSDVKDSEEKSSLVISSIYIDEVLQVVGKDGLPSSPEFLTEIRLNSTQNSMRIHFSDLEYSLPNSAIYEYVIEGKNNKWEKIIGKNDLYINSLPGGVSKLLIRKAGSEEPITTLIIKKDKSDAMYLWLLFAVVSIAFAGYILITRNKSLRNRFFKKTGTESSSVTKYQNVKIDGDEIASIKEVLLRYFETEKPYLDGNLKLDDVAKAINYSKTKTSQVLNQYLNTNFADFTNAYRIEVFKEKAQAGMIQQYTLSALSKECGFSSRSSFFHCFKKLTGQTPLEYLKEKGIE